MATVNIRHLRFVKGRYFFQPSKAMKAAGYSPEPLGSEREKAIARAAELNAQWDRERVNAEEPRIRDGSIVWLIQSYQHSSWYLELAPRTKADVDRYLKIVQDAFPRSLVSEIARKNCREFYDKLRKVRGPTVASDAHKWFRRILSYAIEIGLRTDNPAMKMGIKHPKPRKRVWTDKEFSAFLKASKGTGWELAARIAYDTAQRPADVMRATWQDFDGEGITFQQGKTDETVWVPLSRPTLALLAKAPRDAVQIVTINGKPLVSEKDGRFVLNSVQLSRGFRKIRDAANLPTDLQFRDFRRTAATEIATGGGRIGPVTGHRPGSNMERVYVVPNKDAAREAQKARKNRSRPKVGTGKI